MHCIAWLGGMCRRVWGHTSQAKPSLNLGGVGGQGVVTLYDCRLRTGDIGGDSGSVFRGEKTE